MRLCVKTSTGQIYPVIEEDSTILFEFRQVVAATTQFEIDSFFLSLNKRDRLDNDEALHKSLLDAGLRNGDVIYVLPMDQITNETSQPSTSLQSHPLTSGQDFRPKDHATPVESLKSVEKSVEKPFVNNQSDLMNLSAIEKLYRHSKSSTQTEAVVATMHALFINNGFLELEHKKNLPPSWKIDMNRGYLALFYKHFNSGIILSVSCHAVCQKFSAVDSQPKLIQIRLMAFCCIDESDERKVECVVRPKEVFKDSLTPGPDYKDNFIDWPAFVRNLYDNFVSPAKTCCIGYPDVPLLNIPRELKIKIFKMLPVKYFEKLTSTCRALHLYWDNEIIWRHFVKVDFKDTTLNSTYKQRYIEHYLRYKSFVHGPRPGIERPDFRTPHIFTPPSRPNIPFVNPLNPRSPDDIFPDIYPPTNPFDPDSTGGPHPRIFPRGPGTNDPSPDPLRPPRLHQLGAGPPDLLPPHDFI